MSRPPTLSNKIIAALSDDETLPTRVSELARTLELSLKHMTSMMLYLVKTGRAKRVRPGYYVRVGQ